MLSRFTQMIGLAALAFAAIPDHPATAQERLETERLIISDPTAAKPGQFLLGASADGWYLPSIPVYLYTSGKYCKFDYSGAAGGATVWAGYDSFDLLGTFRKGDFDADSESGCPAAQVVDTEMTEWQITARYRFTGGSITPYVIAGYQGLLFETDRVLTDPNDSWIETGNRHHKTDLMFHTGLVGLGAIVPFGDGSIGLRGDVAGGYTWAESEYVNALPDFDIRRTASGPSVLSHLTLYWQPFSGLSIQAGGKLNAIAIGSNLEGGAAGIFGQIGYSYRF